MKKVFKALLSEEASMAFSERRTSLHFLGMATYKDYLKSRLWGVLRIQVLQRDGFKCYACARAAGSVHHSTYSYDSMSGKDLESLISICEACHEWGEGLVDEDGKKISPGHITEKLKERRLARLRGEPVQFPEKVKGRQEAATQDRKRKRKAKEGLKKCAERAKRRSAMAQSKAMEKEFLDIVRRVD